MDWSPIYDVPPHGGSLTTKADWSGEITYHNHTTHPVKYYLIDYDLSRQYNPGDTPSLPPGYGGDQSVPEFRRKDRCNPFAVDVYCLGNVVRRRFIDGMDPWGPPRRNVEFLTDLISDMTHDDPSERPTMDEVVLRFESIRNGLSWWKLRSRTSDRRVPLLLHLIYSPIHWAVQLSYILRRIPAIPIYTSSPGYSRT